MTALAAEDRLPGMPARGDGIASAVANGAGAVREDWLEIWYQPKIDLHKKCLAGAEAFPRIHHPALGLLPPHEAGGPTGDDITMLLAEHALLATLRDWTGFADAGFNLHLAINVPLHILMRLPIPTLVLENRPRSERWPGLIVEVKEDQIVRDIALAGEIARQLRSSGVTMAIEDFGGGFSSFASLREMPFAELKLDQTFVAGCAADGTNAAICQTAIDLAHRFGGAAVAEGIESPADLQALQVMRCDFGQGPLLAPPMPKRRLLEMLGQRLAKPGFDMPRAERAAGNAA